MIVLMGLAIGVSSALAQERYMNFESIFVYMYISVEEI